MSSPVLLTVSLDLPLLHRGKVRDNYDLESQLLLVTTDRLSAFDVVFAEGIPGKGRILTSLSIFWAQMLPACAPYHLVTTDLSQMPHELHAHRAKLQDRVMLVEKLDMLPVECIVRGRLVGSGWKDYLETGSISGHPLPPNLKLGDALPKPIFTPSTKARHGEHDENITRDHVVDLIGKDLTAALERRSLAIFQQASAFAASKGLVLVDTKLEFGQRPDGTLVLADEVLTPDSSRFWDLAQTQTAAPGAPPPQL